MIKIYKLSSYCTNCPSNEWFFDSKNKAEKYKQKIINENPLWINNQVDYYINEIKVK